MALFNPREVIIHTKSLVAYAALRMSTFSPRALRPQPSAVLTLTRMFIGMSVAACIYFASRRTSFGTFLLECCQAIACTSPVRYLLTKLLMAVSRPVDKCRDFENYLLNASIPKPRSRPGHSHGRLADNRSGMVNWLTNSIKNFNYTYHDFQTNRFGSQLGGDRYGKTRLPYWSKDLDKEPSIDKVEQDLVLMVDVDQYVDLSRFPGKPILMFTFQPQRPAYTADEYMYSVTDGEGPFGKESVFNMDITGGAQYVHGVWDYGSDVVVIGGWTTTVYRVVTRPTNDENWRIIILTPIICYGIIGKIINILLKLEGRSLKRLDCVTGPVAMLRSVGADGKRKIYATLADGVVTNSIEIDPKAYDAVRVFSQTSGLKTLHGTQQRLNRPDLSASADLMSLGIGKPIDTAGYSTCRYREPVFEQAVSKMVDLCPPLVANGCWTPMVSGGNFTRAIDTRIIEARSDVSTDNQLMGWFHELLEGPLCRHRGSLVPMDGTEVRERQNAPRQRQNLEAAENLTIDPERTQPFLKAECYGDDKDPRIITPAGPAHKFEASRYQYAIAEWLKSFDWYAFGKTPQEIADLVADVCAHAEEGVNDSDSRRHDGHVNEFIRDLELGLMLFLFPKENHEGLVTEWKKSFGNNAVMYAPGDTKHIFFSGFNRSSGEPETSNTNSFDTRIAVYFAWRIAGLNCEDAWDKKCMCGGDDLHAADVSNKHLTKAYNRMGLDIKVNWIPRGSYGVNFLSRFYGPAVWEGCPDSMCDLPRALSKFHVTVNLPVASDSAKETRMIEKANSYLLTDGSTPYIGELARALVSRPTVKRKSIGHDVNMWWSRFDKTVQWPNHYGSWMMDYCADWGMADTLTKASHPQARAALEVAKLQLKTERWESLSYEPIWVNPLDIKKPVLINEELHVPLETQVDPIIEEGKGNADDCPELVERVDVAKAHAANRQVRRQAAVEPKRAAAQGRGKAQGAAKPKAQPGKPPGKPAGGAAKPPAAPPVAAPKAPAAALGGQPPPKAPAPQLVGPPPGAG